MQKLGADMMPQEPNACCSPVRDDGVGLPCGPAPAKAAAHFPLPTVTIPGGKALLGTNAPLIPDDGEAPLRRTAVRPFALTATTVTNAAFARFIQNTGHVTEAERFGWSFVFYSDVPKDSRDTQGVLGTEWWRKVEGANWRAPRGPGSDQDCHPDHPAVHISWNDAVAFANWCGGRLPTEAEWEHAARGGSGDVRFPWGAAEPDDHSFLPCNIWQGQFPRANTGADGWKCTAPAKSFEPNAFGLYNMVGNVWEWTADPFRVRSLKKAVRRKLDAMRGFKLLKGGSFLCHRSYCYRYRIASRIGNSPDTTAPHQGFRVVWDA